VTESLASLGMELPAPTVGIAKIKREFRKAENQEETKEKGN
jgi:hypothetical protein